MTQIRPRAIFLLALFAAPTTVLAQEFEVHDGDRIAIIGNQFADHLRLYGYFETLLRSQNVGKSLYFRNLGWSGDMAHQQLRPTSFGDLHSHLRAHQINIVVACFGMMESFRGSEGLDDFRSALQDLVRAMKGHRYQGRSPPQIVLVTPIYHEDVGGDYPDPADHNRSLAAYAQAMRGIARQERIACVDLFAVTRGDVVNHGTSGGSRPALTSDGIHPTDQGYFFISQILARELGLLPSDCQLRSGTRFADQAEPLRRAIVDRNFHFYMRWRALNGEYNYGRRKNQWGLARELRHQDRVVQAHDQRVASLSTVSFDELWPPLSDE